MVIIYLPGANADSAGPEEAGAAPVVPVRPLEAVRATESRTSCAGKTGHSVFQ